jgi:hypothetical protein
MLRMDYALMGMAYTSQAAHFSAQVAQQNALNLANLAQQSMYNQQGYNQPRVSPVSASRPCPYCGRTSHKAGHKSCDGCGASQ